MNKTIRIFSILSMLFILIILKNRKKIKICICTIGKKENLYAREFVEYYKDLGVNKIFIYDNNEKNDEKFDIVLKNYIENKFVEIIDFRGIEGPQLQSMEDCRKKNFKNYNWLIFFDMDEFLFLRNYSHISDFLNQKIFDRCQRVQLNWFFHTDNNLLYYENKTLKERFPQTDKRWNGIKLGGEEGIKSILKGNIDIEINNVHYLNPNLISCNGFGKIKEVKGIITNESDHYYYYIDHYWSKSTEEFVNKLMRGDVVLGKNTNYSNNKINMYFHLCDITIDKINYIENRTKLNLTHFKVLLQKNTNK